MAFSIKIKTIPQIDIVLIDGLPTNNNKRLSNRHCSVHIIVLIAVKKLYVKKCCDIIFLAFFLSQITPNLCINSFYKTCVSFLI